ncbi:MAG TPA: type IV toxin-antitoxin system AbiEi family antitoxin domain-containing protein [Tepidisphaeraceae bacterium]|nr:type IV toxin-antitoxin system AbiEi family antitoxin domain-containing protein [Tepidisphaeraceae bacterium]
MNSTHRARKVFRAHGGTMRTTEILTAGIHPRTLYAMRDAGEVESIARGVFRLGDLPPLGNPDLATVAKRVPRAVICLISALAFHELTTEVPHEVHVAMPRTARNPRLDYPPVRVYRFSKAAFNAGVEAHVIDRIPVRIYTAEKTLADGFKYRHKIGMSVVLEALHTYRRRRYPRFQQVFEFARLCRVERQMRPYLEALA